MKLNPRQQHDPVRSWSAARLPKLRDQTVTALRDRGGFIHEMLTSRKPVVGNALEGPYAPDQGGADLLAHNLADADLYWVTPPMAELAVGASESLDEMRWCASEQPATTGLLVWDEGLTVAQIGALRVPITAVSWHPHCEAGMSMCFYMARNQLDHVMSRAGFQMRPNTELERALADLPPLVPVWSTEVATTSEWTPIMAKAPYSVYSVQLAALYSTWKLMMQPGIADHTRQEVEPKVRKAIARSGRPVPDVTLVELRRKQRPRNDGTPATTSSGRVYRHQWVVPGFWRNQACGPGWSQHKKIWINDFTKGPDGAPMITRVNVWRR